MPAVIEAPGQLRPHKRLERRQHIAIGQVELRLRLGLVGQET
jgi:hypothetical protein